MWKNNNVPGFEHQRFSLFQPDRSPAAQKEMVDNHVLGLDAEMRRNCLPRRRANPPGQRKLPVVVHGALQLHGS